MSAEKWMCSALRTAAPWSLIEPYLIVAYRPVSVYICVLRYASYRQLLGSSVRVATKPLDTKQNSITQIKSPYLMSLLGLEVAQSSGSGQIA